MRVGDFGLATRHRVDETEAAEEEEQGVPTKYEAIEDISSLLGGSRHESQTSEMSAGESMTGGVGTTFYRAPEQEHTLTRKKSESTYGTPSDIFSLGVILFEMFYSPFSTYMERAETLTTLRGDHASSNERSSERSTSSNGNANAGPLAWREQASQRFPDSFLKSAPDNAQRMILLCLDRTPSRRPSAEALLAVRP